LLATASVVPLFVLISWLPNWLVALNPMVMIDNFVWVVFLLSLGLVLVATAFVRSAGGAKKRTQMAALRG
jgi:hypothetical protein